MNSHSREREFLKNRMHIRISLYLARGRVLKLTRFLRSSLEKVSRRGDSMFLFHRRHSLFRLCSKSPRIVASHAPSIHYRSRETYYDESSFQDSSFIKHRAKYNVLIDTETKIDLLLEKILENKIYKDDEGIYYTYIKKKVFFTHQKIEI